MPPEDSDFIVCRLTELMDDRGMSLNELSQRVGITLANLSILKNNKARAIRFSTLAAICQALDCEIGELLVYVPEGPRVSD